MPSIRVAVLSEESAGLGFGLSVVLAAVLLGLLLRRRSLWWEKFRALRWYQLLIPMAAWAGAVIFMAGGDDDAWAMTALSAGARGILAGGVRAQDLVKAVRVVSEGQVWARRDVLARTVRGATSSVAAHEVEPMPDPRLSGREREVYRKAAMGLSNEELAKRLAISQATVKAHLTSIFQKLGLRGRAELAAAYHGLLPLAPRRSGPARSRRPRSGYPLRSK